MKSYQGCSVLRIISSLASVTVDVYRKYIRIEILVILRLRAVSWIGVVVGNIIRGTTDTARSLIVNIFIISSYEVAKLLTDGTWDSL
jgi:hypothetical protein